MLPIPASKSKTALLYSAMLLLVSCQESSSAICTYEVADKYVVEGKKQIGKVIAEHVRLGQYLGDGANKIPIEELANINPSDIEFSRSDAEGSSALLGFMLIYNYKDWRFIVSYDRRCNVSVGWCWDCFR